MDIAQELAAISTQQRHLTARLEAVIEELHGSVSAPVFDPWQDPPVQPLVDGDRTQRDWCALLLWGQLLAVNVRENRGATKPEVVQFAKRAGYADGRGWNKWSGWKEDEDGRWVTPAGVGHIRHYYAAVNRSLPSDLAEAAEQLSI